MALLLADSAFPDLTHPSACRSIVLVPLGATEQHGPHLPLCTDTDVAAALAQRCAQALPGCAVAPALAYGASGEHRGFAGTISIGCEALAHLLVELGRSASETFERIVLVCAHGGNAEPLAAAVRTLRQESVNVIAWSPRWNGDAHAGRVETSVMLALRPDLVRMDRACAGERRPLPAIWPQLRRGGVRAVSENGVLGDPKGASAQEGERLLNSATARLVEAVLELEQRTSSR